MCSSDLIGTDSLFGVAFSDDGTLVSVGGADNRLRVIRVESGEQQMRMDAHADWVLGTTFSLKSDHVISVSRDRSMKLSIVSNGQFVDNITSITPGALKGGLADVQRMPAAEEVLAGGADGEPRLYKIFREQARQIGEGRGLARLGEVVDAQLRLVRSGAERRGGEQEQETHGQGWTHPNPHPAAVNPPTDAQDNA